MIRLLILLLSGFTLSLPLDVATAQQPDGQVDDVRFGPGRGDQSGFGINVDGGYGYGGYGYGGYGYGGYGYGGYGR